MECDRVLSFGVLLKREGVPNATLLEERSRSRTFSSFAEARAEVAKMLPLACTGSEMAEYLSSTGANITKQFNGGAVLLGTVPFSAFSGAWSPVVEFFADNMNTTIESATNELCSASIHDINAFFQCR